MTAGIERSMPRAISTRASPIDAMQRNAAKGMMARIEVAIRLRGTKIALMTMSTSQRDPDCEEARLRL